MPECSCGGKPLLFDEFIQSGYEESHSPFLTSSSRWIGKNLELKASISAAIFLAAAFLLQWFPSQEALSHWLVVFVYFIVGAPALIRAIDDLMEFNINIEILMTLAAFSSVALGSGIEGALLLVLFAVSGAMETGVTSKAAGTIHQLYKLSPTMASVLLDDGTLLQKAVADVKVGSKILVRAGEVLPLDGVVVEGSSLVSLAHLTGESVPDRKTVGDEVPAGGATVDGFLTIKVTRPSSSSTLSRIIQLVTEAQEARPSIQRWFDRLSQPYAKSIIALSFIFAASFPWLLNIPVLGHEGSVYRALAFLIAASPCALIIATPIVYLSAISSCARRGILLKGGVILDALASCQVVASDKTGTLTTGQLRCLSMEGLHPLSNEDERKFWSLAVALERKAIHPMAKAIVAYGEAHEIVPEKIQQFEAVTGQGLQGLHEGKPVAIGRAEFIAERLSSSRGEELLHLAKELKRHGDLITAMHIGDDLVLFRFVDEVRSGIRETIDNLKKGGQEVVMLTGDHEASAQRVAEELGIQETYAQLTPEDKLVHVARMAKEKGLIMVGDGVNDAPALARATVGIAMGSVGTTTAIEAAGVVLLRDDIQLLDWLVCKARKTRKVIQQNVFLASLAILGASIPALSGIVPLWLAVILHEGGTVLVGLNGLRLLRD